MSNDNGKTHFADDDTLAYIQKLEDKLEGATILNGLQSQELNLQRKELAEAKKDTIMVFSEERVPQFSQGYKSHELLEVLTADEVTNYVNQIEELTAELAETKKDFSEKDADFRNLCLEYEVLDKELTAKLQASQAHVERLREALRLCLGAIQMMQPCVDPECKQTQTEWKDDAEKLAKEALAATVPKENKHE